MTVELRQVGVWRTAAGLGPELAVEVEALGYGAIWIGGSPPGDLALAESLLGRHRADRGRHRHRQHVGDPGRRRSPSPTTGSRRRYPGRFLLGVGHRAPGGRPRSTAARTPRSSTTWTGWTRAEVPVTGRALAALGPEGAAAGRRADRRRAPVPDHAGAHPAGPRAARRRRAARARSRRWCWTPTPSGPARSAARSSTAATWPAQLHLQPAAAGLDRRRPGRRRQRRADRRAGRARRRGDGGRPAHRAPRRRRRPRLRAGAHGRRRRPAAGAARAGRGALRPDAADRRSRGARSTQLRPSGAGRARARRHAGAAAGR